MKIIETAREMKEEAARLRSGGRKIAFVPTMGCLHAGHLALVGRARTLGDTVVVSVFVNPAQFGPAEDYKNYPRDMKKDAAIAEKAGVDMMFHPAALEVYPKGYGTLVKVEGLSEKLCGASRPGHFNGVATVVVKLFNMVTPHAAVFGLKDYQQQLIIRKLVKDLNMDVEIFAVETVREEDGLAMSSRNLCLSAGEREAARCIPRALEAAQEAYSKGERHGARIIESTAGVIKRERFAAAEYIRLCDPETLDDLDEAGDRAILSVAVRIGRARLIDNCMLGRGYGKILNS
ncbi:MAG: pantoate--beta-alanine ligase [Deltaproteobacteria bacterium]|nr:pantoate--beta-alanine ligase [Deltaproteobacteria bacterium]